MTDTPPAFTPEPPDPRLEALEEEIAELVAEALYEYILRHGLPGREASSHRQLRTAETQADAET